MSEAEFWASTVAKVVALRDLKYEYDDKRDKRRDFFVAYLLATFLNSKIESGSRSFSAGDFLNMQYPPEEQSVMITPKIPKDVMGIQGNWQALQNYLKDEGNKPTGRKF